MPSDDDRQHVEISYWTLDKLWDLIKDDDRFEGMIKSNIKLCRERSFVNESIVKCPLCNHNVGIYDTRWKGSYDSPICGTCIDNFARYGCD